MSIDLGPKLGLIINGTTGDPCYDQIRPFFRFIDALLLGNILNATAIVPPTSPNNGDAYLLLGSPLAGAWQGEQNKIAVWSTEIDALGGNTKVPGWDFWTPNPGWTVFDTSNQAPWVFINGSWTQSAHLTAPVTITTPNPASKGLIVKGSALPPPAVVQSSWTAGAGGGSASHQAFNAATAAGNAIVVLIAFFNGSVQVTDTQNNTYSLLWSTTNQGGAGQAVLASTNTVGGPNTVTITPTNSGTSQGIFVLEVSGLASVPFDAASGTGAGAQPAGTYSSGNVTTTAANDLLLSFMLGAGAFTENQGFSSVAGDFTTAHCFSLLATTAGSYADQMTTSTAGNQGIAIVALKATVTGASQTAALEEWQSPAGAVLASVSGVGQFTINSPAGLAMPNGPLTLGGGATITNVSGTSFVQIGNNTPGTSALEIAVVGTAVDVSAISSTGVNSPLLLQNGGELTTIGGNLTVNGTLSLSGSITVPGSVTAASFQTPGGATLTGANGAPNWPVLGDQTTGHGALRVIPTASFVQVDGVLWGTGQECPLALQPNGQNASFGGKVFIENTAAVTANAYLYVGPLSGSAPQGGSIISAGNTAGTPQLTLTNGPGFVGIFNNNLPAADYNANVQGGDSGIIYSSNGANSGNSFTILPWGTGGGFRLDGSGNQFQYGNLQVSQNVTGQGNLTVTGTSTLANTTALTLKVGAQAISSPINATILGGNNVATVPQLAATNGTGLVGIFNGNLPAQNYNPIVQGGDSALIYSSAGLNSNGAFDIAPWSSTGGGIRLDASGNVTVTGNLTVSGQIISTSYRFPNTFSTQWVKLGTWVTPAIPSSLGIRIDAGSGYNTNANNQQYADITLRTGNQQAAPNLSGALLVQTGSNPASFGGLQVGATGGSTSAANGSWDVYVLAGQFMGGLYTVALNYATDSWTHIGSMSSNSPGAASSSMVIGTVTQTVTSNFAGNVAISGLVSAGNGVVTHNVSTGDVNNLTLTANNVVISANAFINSSLFVNAVSVNQSLATGGLVSVGGTLHATGAVTFASTLEVSGSAQFDGAATVNGFLVAGSLGVALTAVVQGMATFNGGLTTNAAANFNSGGNMAGSWTGNPVFQGNPFFNGAPLSVNPASNDNSGRLATTAWVQSFLNSGFSSSFPASPNPGFIRFPNSLGGLILQWGLTGNLHGGSATVSFPTPFSSNGTVFSIQVTAFTGGNGDFLYVTSFTNTGFVVHDDGSGASAWWLAVGV